ncbi:hypothetical protein [Streptomyces cupreus]|uniref:Uncharacterized protein n=1 Tax=Streptomyces cupreus TaxID=2759956 RepID=A0A7X1J0T1_9ACTN|nr:hypothetical protein [Streptomyces cupreus]MBC2901534.1 hypothetical protein [Streptomyces cupreus]
MSAPNGTVPPPPSAPPGSGGGQPAWAWWVIGIVIPVVGIAVTLSVANKDSGDSDTDTPAAATGTQNEDPGQASGTPAGNKEDAKGDAEEASPSPVAPEYGPADWSVQAAYGDHGYLEFDSGAPQEFGQRTDGTDLYLDATAGEPVDADGQIGPLPAGTADATEAECRTQIEKNGLSEVELAPGIRFCVQTGEGRTAYLRVLSAPVEDEGAVRFKVTVWPLPQ